MNIATETRAAVNQFIAEMRDLGMSGAEARAAAAVALEFSIQGHVDSLQEALRVARTPFAEMRVRNRSTPGTVAAFDEWLKYIRRGLNA